MLLDRRRVCAAGALALSAAVLPAQTLVASPNDTLEERVLEVPGEKLARQCLLLVPKGGARRLLVLMHGLGETSSQKLGIRAWVDRYGLASADQRLRRPPLARTLTDAVYLTDDRLAELNRELARAPYRGLALACPFTPNVYAEPSTAGALDRYAEWLVERLLPELRRELGLADGPVAIDGVSLGGFVSLEVFLRKPEAFAAAGSLQGAFGSKRVASFVERFERAFERAGRRPIRIATSSWDKGRPVSERLVERLGERGIAAALRVTPGPHDQRFLREAGAVELLFHYDRTLAEEAARPAATAAPNPERRGSSRP